MASSTPLQEFITCNICFEIHNNPQSLTCLHVYCHDCIHRLKQGTQVQCPDCRETCLIHDLKKDFRTQTLVDEYNIQTSTLKTLLASSGSMRVCDICKESTKAAKCFCEVCQEFLCKDCKKAHKGMKISKDHKLINFVQMLNETQRDIEKEIEKLEAQRIDVQENVSSVDSFTRQLYESKEQLIGEVNKCRSDIKQRVDEHHDELINQIKSTIDSLHETLKETKSLLMEHDSKVEEKVSFLSDVCNSEDYSLIKNTLANLADQIEKDLHQMDSQLTKFCSNLTCPVTVLKGEEWEPRTSTQLCVTHETVEHIRELMYQSKVLQRKKTLHQNYKQVKCVDIEYYPEKLCLCNDELWVGGWDKGVFVYDLNLQQTNHIQHHQLQNVSSVAKAPTGVIVCDYDTGLHHLNHQGLYTNLISSGHFVDASLTSNNKIYALEYVLGEIHTFVKNENSWVKDTKFKLVRYSDGSFDDRLCITSTHVYVSSCNTDCILVYTLTGEYVYKTGDGGDDIRKFNHPYLSDLDSEGKWLLCVDRNHRLQVFDTQNREWSELSGLEDLKWPESAQVGDKHLWVGTGYLSGNKKLYKYEAL